MTDTFDISDRLTESGMEQEFADAVAEKLINKFGQDRCHEMLARMEKGKKTWPYDDRKESPLHKHSFIDEDGKEWQYRISSDKGKKMFPFQREEVLKDFLNEPLGYYMTNVKGWGEPHSEERVRRTIWHINLVHVNEGKKEECKKQGRADVKYLIKEHLKKHLSTEFFILYLLENNFVYHLADLDFSS